MTTRDLLSARGRSFRKDERGSVAIIAGVVMMVLIMAVGAAVDFARAYRLKAVLQAAADGAALAAGAKQNPNLQEMKDIASSYVKANADVSDWARLGAINVTYDAATELVTIGVNGDLDTTFLRAAGLKELDVRVNSEVRRATPGPMELVLALDVTRSMNDNITGSKQSKIAALRVAAKALVNKVMQSPPGTVSVGIVPYSAYMNVGTSDPSPPWVGVPPPRTVQSCTQFAPLPPNCTTEWYDCYIDGVWKVRGCARANPPGCTNRPCVNWVRRTDVWRGCVGARTGGNGLSNTGTDVYLDSIDNPTNPRYPGIFNESVGGCTAEILDLTTNKRTIDAKIDGLTVFGDTYIPSGLLWAWNVLDPRAPYTTAKSLASLQLIGGKKVVVLMTDGINWQVPRFRDGMFLNPDNPEVLPQWRDGKKLDDLTKRLCQKLEDSGILVYTILFDVKDRNVEELLRGCATTDQMSYRAENSQDLLKAFEDIGIALSKLRVTE